LNKPPAFQFYPKDWFDYKVMRMSYEAQGVYIRILSHMWKDSEDMCSFPKNVKSVCKILGISTRKWTKIYNELQKHHDPIFIENEHRFISKRLQGEAIKLMQYRELASRGGKKSAVKRWGKKGKGTYKGGYKGTGKGRVTLQSSSSSSTSSSNNNILKEYIILSKLLGELILKRSPNDFHVKKAQKNGWIKWAENIRLMVEEDGCSLEEIEKVIKWCQEDSFWKTNVRSTAKLRLQFGQLVDKMKNKYQQEDKMEEAKRLCEEEKNEQG